MFKGNNKEKNKQNANVGTKRIDNSEDQIHKVFYSLRKVTNSKKN